MKEAAFDTETDALYDYSRLHVVVFCDLESDDVVVFRRVHDDPEPLRQFVSKLTKVVGHNSVGFDNDVILKFTGVDLYNRLEKTNSFIDTLVISRTLNYAQPGGHSLEAYGERWGTPKSTFSDFSEWSQELEDRCIQDTLLTKRLYNTLKIYLKVDQWVEPLRLELKTSYLCSVLEHTGFTFDYPYAITLRDELQKKIDDFINLFDLYFPPKFVPVREIHPKATKTGSLNSKDFRWNKTGDLSSFSIDAPFTLLELVPFNPGSPSQIVTRLNEFGWKPTEKTKGHIEAVRRRDSKALEGYRVTGWRVCSQNLETLPEGAPEPAKRLSDYLLFKSRLDDLKEWIELYDKRDGRIHGHFNHIGSWTGRKSHSRPNMANIPALVNRHGKPQPYGAEFRSLWMAKDGRVLVGTDAEGIQLRLFAHYCNDLRLIKAITEGKKENKSDIHSLNKQVLDTICNSREVAKTYIYALLLGAGTGKQAEILSCSAKEAAEGLERILDYYPGWKILKETTIAADARRGYFIGLDGRQVLFPSERHILAGYLQNGESAVMKKACLLWHSVLGKARIPFWMVNDVHDEWVTETLPQFTEIVGKVQADSIRLIGEELNLNCPLSGSYKVGPTWKEVH